ncbi:hypothetical protein, partial [Marinomonas arenicola]
VEQLANAYQLLRRTQHALQAVKDEQTQLLPYDETERTRIALMVGYASCESLDSALWDVRRNVHRLFLE